MTKKFCDICEAPIVEKNQRISTKLENKSWSGYKSSGHGSGCDGRWIPEITARVNFDIENQKDNPSTHTPDLCVKCMADLVGKLKEWLES